MYDEESFVRSKAIHLLQEIVVKNIEFDGKCVQIVCLFLFIPRGDFGTFMTDFLAKFLKFIENY